jgi:hypothetical protein
MRANAVVHVLGRDGDPAQFIPFEWPVGCDLKISTFIDGRVVSVLIHDTHPVPRPVRTIPDERIRLHTSVAHAYISALQSNRVAMPSNMGIEKMASGLSSWLSAASSHALADARTLMWTGPIRFHARPTSPLEYNDEFEYYENMRCDEFEHYEYDSYYEYMRCDEFEHYEYDEYARYSNASGVVHSDADDTPRPAYYEQCLKVPGALRSIWQQMACDAHAAKEMLLSLFGAGSLKVKLNSKLTLGSDSNRYILVGGGLLRRLSLEIMHMILTHVMRAVLPPSREQLSRKRI